MQKKLLLLLFCFFAALLYTTSWAANDSILSQQRFCLSIDGGGLRGVVPAKILAGIEEKLGKPIAHLFRSGITGTSTGALIALGLAAKKDMHSTNSTPLFSASELVTFYFEHRFKIFGNQLDSECCDCLNTERCCKISFWELLTCCCCFNRCGGGCGPKYSNSYLRKKLTGYFGDRTMKDVLVPVQVVAFDVTTYAPRYFSSQTTPNVKMVDAALASAAAPTFLPPHKFQSTNDNSTTYRCIDGGIFENNPAFSALRYAIELYREEYSKRAGYNEPEMNDFKIISIGTGVVAKETISKYEKLSSAGKLKWAC